MKTNKNKLGLWNSTINFVINWQRLTIKIIPKELKLFLTVN